MEMTFRRTNITNCPFENPHIRRILDREIDKMMHRTEGKGLAVDPFARESFTNSIENFVTNDLNPEFDTDYNMEFKDFARRMEFEVDYNNQRMIDLVFFDPPYSLRQLKEQYDGIGKDLELWQTHNQWGAGKDHLARIMPVGSRVVSLGWTTSGWGAKRGFEKVAVHVFEQVAREDRYALLVTVEEKVQHSLIDFESEE